MSPFLLPLLMLLAQAACSPTPKESYVELDDCQNAATHGSDYTGRVRTTYSGRACQSWSSQSPHQHSLSLFLRDYTVNDTETLRMYGQKNYCRNPDSSLGGPWCFTMDPAKRWEICGVPKCPTPTGCQNGATKGADYTGTMNITKSGKTCQAWNSNKPHKHNKSSQVKKIQGNPCRNPNKYSGGLWCYTTDKEMRWEKCDVPTCKGACAEIFADVKYRGASMLIADGREFKNLHRVVGKWNDEITSMKIIPGCKLQFWEHANGAKGATATTTEDIPKLKDIEYTNTNNKKRDWNDKISSIKCTCG